MPRGKEKKERKGKENTMEKKGKKKVEKNIRTEEKWQSECGRDFYAKNEGKKRGNKKNDEISEKEVERAEESKEVVKGSGNKVLALRELGAC